MHGLTNLKFLMVSKLKYCTTSKIASMPELHNFDRSPSPSVTTVDVFIYDWGVKCKQTGL